jgi:hypothetical protein
MPDPSEKNEVQCAAGGRHIAPTFSIIDAQSSMPDHRCPIHRKNREVQFAAGGLQIAQTFPIIDASFFWHAH